MAGVRSGTRSRAPHALIAAMEAGDFYASSGVVLADVKFDKQYPVTINHAERTAETSALLGELFGAERVPPFDNPLMGSEDFSFFANEVPGFFYRLGQVKAGTTSGKCMPT